MYESQEWCQLQDTKPDEQHLSPTQQESSKTSGSSSPPSNTSPFQALNLTDPWATGWFSADLQTETFRQWMMMCWTASELSRCKKFIWTRPTVIAGCSNKQNRHRLTPLLCGHTCNIYNVIILQTLLTSFGFYGVLNTLDTVIGFRQVCPPPVKLQETSMVSDEQPRLGSIQ